MRYYKSINNINHHHHHHNNDNNNNNNNNNNKSNNNNNKVILIRIIYVEASDSVNMQITLSSAAVKLRKLTLRLGTNSLVTFRMWSVSSAVGVSLKSPDCLVPPSTTSSILRDNTSIKYLVNRDSIA